MQESLRAIDHWYDQHEEPNRSCLLALRSWILDFNPRIAECWKYRMPMFCVNAKMFCYLWTDKKTKQPYLGIVEGKHIKHPLLIQGDRARMKILPIDPEEDLPVKAMKEVLSMALSFYH